MATPAKPPSIQILALGMPRTGTMSIKLALEHLGYKPTYHGLDIFQRPHDSVLWTQLLRKKHYQHQPLTRADLDGLFNGYAAITDLSFLLWQDLLDAYPDAKLILVQRPVETWYTSFSKTLMPGLFTYKSALITTLLEPLLGTQFGRMGEMMQLSFFDSSSQAEFRAHAKEKYVNYYVDVRAAAKARGREVLEFELGEGWAPLCRFLGREVPVGVQFPRANEEREILEFWRVQRWRMGVWGVGVLGRWLGPWFVVVGVVVLCFMAR